ncbi:MAG: hypothetical protein LWW96_19275 [Acidovorax sp.]|uniref:hypothetical protein n=1 Tax=Acidovorax sp. TaxID=1872122 RepID=UPI0025BC18DA|nr:hypothetical protein [Acidovorax sp.]MCE1194292.1 hypothetical protein [Acidovorax sp.]
MLVALHKNARTYARRACNQLLQSALGSKTPMQAMKEWYRTYQQLFHKRSSFGHLLCNRGGTHTSNSRSQRSLTSKPSNTLGPRILDVLSADHLRGSMSSSGTEIVPLGVFGRCRSVTMPAGAPLRF